MSLRCFIQTQAPVPHSGAEPVNYPACEWMSDDGTVDQLHPLNRFVCSWLSSDMVELSHCDQVLQMMAQLEVNALKEWFVDGDAFNVDMRIKGVQFNQSNVTPKDTAYWNHPEGKFTLAQLKTLMLAWREYLIANAQP